MEKQSGLACAALVVCENSLDHGVTDGVETRARQMIRSKAADLLEGGGNYIGLLSSSLIESILKDDKMEADEYTMFLLLQKWTNEADEERYAAAASLTNCISLESIDPSKLSTTVQESDLVTAEKLNEAYKKQALNSEERHGISFKKRRFHRAVWEISNDISVAFQDLEDHANVEFLNYPVMTSGVHKWTIEVQTKYIHTKDVFGVALNKNRPARTLGYDQRGWGLRSNGCIIHNKRLVARDCHENLRFSRGSLVRMELDLRKQAGGTLSVSIDGHPLVVIFTNMLHHLRNEAAHGGFVPAISLFEGSRVRLLEIVTTAE